MGLWKITRVQTAVIDADDYETKDDESDEEKISEVAHELSFMDYLTEDVFWEELA